MFDLKIYQVDYFLLAPEWREDGVACSRISFCITGGNTEVMHNAFCLKEKERLEKEHDDDYTSWVCTAKKTKEFYGALKFASVIHFRIRDAWEQCGLEDYCDITSGRRPGSC